MPCSGYDYGTTRKFKLKGIETGNFAAESSIFTLVCDLPGITASFGGIALQEHGLCDRTCVFNTIGSMIYLTYLHLHIP
jgi:hypothetical protein